MNNKFFASILILIFSSAFAYSQSKDVTVKVKTEKSVSENLNDGIKAGAAATTARAAETTARAAAATAAAAAVEAQAKLAEAMSESSSNVKVPLEVDLYNYTHIAIIDATFAYPNGNQISGKSTYKQTAETLANSPLSIIVPHEYDKKKFKENNRFLRDIKNPEWIYLYYTKSIQGVDEIRALVIRDYKNKILYNVTTINTPIDEVVSPIVNF